MFYYKDFSCVNHSGDIVLVMLPTFTTISHGFCSKMAFICSILQRLFGISNVGIDWIFVVSFGIFSWDSLTVAVIKSDSCSIISLSFSIVSSFKSSILLSHILIHFAFVTVISGSKLELAFLMRVSRSVLISLLILGYFPSDLNQEIITISNFLKSKISLKKNSLLPEISSISIKYHFFLALWIFDIYQTILYGQVFFSSFNRDKKVHFFIYGYNQSNKCHETNALKTSCSIIKFSSKDVSKILLKVIFCVLSSQPKSHILIVCEDFDRSNNDVMFCKSVLRL
ncbi:MAG: hypothetical protein BWY04_00950 [candidate division CPR1 bacterium ADurb.Bin160]|jgi:hypothetical protein|uniref:Uncharacterized protein n=1 Tax=candidate division CPR1 bacterium ADurb.Bin160 TaxID=1852826 RepID=A0A1V5ZMD2_9BACT|nr:MAG: hypothetical protein BWY04_00950 [candidate division CPR1 bacterium ADurb.Bin160]